MRKLINSFFLILFVSLIPAAVKSDQKSPELRLGVIIALTGDWANFSEGASNAMRLAMEKLPPEVRSKVRLIVEDDRSETKQSVAAFQKLLTVDKINALVTWSSATSKAVAPLAESAKIPTIAIASDPAVVKGRKYIFNLWVTPEQETEAVIAEALKRGYSKIARITTINDSSLSIKNAFDKGHQGRFQMVLDEEFPPSDRDFRAYLTKLRNRTPIDALLVVLNPGQVGLFAKQCREMGIQAPLFGYETFEDSNEVKTSNGALEKAWFTTAADMEGNFMREFESLFPKSSKVTASNTFDAVTLQALAGEKASSPEDQIRYLSQLRDYQGASGKFSSTGDNRFSLPATLKVVSGMEFKPLQ
jgi:ABC-type branched-subunit amino acid transport system substrate-binding protein